MRRGFTLIELVAVIVILSIMVGLALPRYFDHAAQAKVAATKGSLGGVRTAIASWHMDQAMAGNAVYPTQAQLISDVMPNDEFPENPYNGLSTVHYVASAVDATNRVVNGASGWRYRYDNGSNPKSFIFWANSNEAGENAF